LLGYGNYRLLADISKKLPTNLTTENGWEPTSHFRLFCTIRFRYRSEHFEMRRSIG
jgi:hypothetical protein